MSNWRNRKTARPCLEAQLAEIERRIRNYSRSCGETCACGAAEIEALIVSRVALGD